MAKKIFNRKTLALVLALVMCFSVMSMGVSAATNSELSRLSGIKYDRAGGYYYVNAQVYLLYQNTIPKNIQQSFGIDLFGPSGNNDPYITVKVNMNKLTANEGIEIYKTNSWGSSSWYISYQTSTGYTAESLWTKILDAMETRGQEFFRDYFKDNYIGYVLKVEGNECHIDGVYKVDPAYFTEVYIDGDLKTTFIGTEAHNFNEDVLGWFEETYPGITWNERKTEGTFTAEGKEYTIELVKNSRFDVNTGRISYTEKTNDFFVAAFYYELTEIEVPTEPPATEPPATEPPATEPPATEPPATEPPATEPPATEPPATEPPATEPPATEPPATEPPATEPPATEPPATEPPATEPPATEPPATEPPATEPPATEPPATEPPATEPPATEPPATEPPATEPPATEPPATEPPATEPPATEPPATEPPATEPPVIDIPEEDPPLVDIPEDDVPLTDVPTTGDPMVLYAVMTALSGGGLIALGMKKKKED